MAEYDAKIRVGTEVDTSQMQKLQIQIDKATQKVDSLAKKYDEVKNKKIPTTQYAELEKKLADTKAQLENLIAEENKLADAGLTIGAPWDNIIAKEADAQLKIERITAEMQKLEDAGKAFSLDLNNDEIAKAATDLSMAEAELRALTTRQEELNIKQIQSYGNTKKIGTGFKKLAAVAGKAFKAISGGTKKSNGMLSTMASRLKCLALSLLVFNWISKGFNAMVSSMKEGFQNLSKYSSDFNGTMSEFKSQLATMKNSLAAAFAPIVSMIIPYLTQFVSWINTACDTLSRFLALLSGKSTYTKAKQQMVDYADSIDGAKNSAEEAQGALAGFDKLNVIGNQDNKSSGSGGKEAQFEEAEIGEMPDFAKKLKDAIKNGDWFSVGALLGQKLNEILRNINWSDIQNGAKRIASNIAMFLNGFIAATDWNLVGATIAQGLNTAFWFVYTFITTFDWKNAGQAVADSINGFFANVDWALVGATISEGFKSVLIFLRTALQETDWKAIGEDIAILLQNIDWIGLLANIGGLIVDAVIAGLDLASGFFGVMLEGTFLEPLVGTIENLKTFLLEFVDFLGGILTGDMDRILSGLQKMFSTSLDAVKIAIKFFGNFFIGILNGMVAASETALNLIVKAINKSLEAVYMLISGSADLLKMAGVNINFQPKFIPEVNLGRIPKLANGAVIRGGQPFLALLGDQPKGHTNIEAPLSTIEQAMRNTLRENGGVGGGEYTIILQVSGREIHREVVRQEQMFKKSTGVSSFA